MASLLNFLGKAADKIIPGNQSYLHNGTPVKQQVQQAAQQVQHTASNVVNNVVQHPGQAVQNVAKTAAHVLTPPVMPAINAANYVVHNPTQAGQQAGQFNNNVVKPVGKGLFNVAKGLTVDTPITVGKAANKAMNMGGQQREVNAALATANNQEDSAWRDYRSGKIKGDRAAALINDAAKQRAIATGTFQNQMAQGPSAKDAGMALGMLGLAAVGGPLAQATKAGGALGMGAKVAEGTIGTGFAANTIHQLPQEINQIKQLKGPERTQAITEAVGNTGLGVVGGAAAIHGFTPVIKAGAKGAKPYVNNEGGYFAPQEAVNFSKYQKQGKPVINFPDGRKGVAISDQKATIKPEGAQALANGHEVHLADVLDHKQMQQDLPILFSKEGTGGVKVMLDATNPGARGFMNPTTNTIHLNPEVLGWKRGTKVTSAVRQRLEASLQTTQGKKILSHEISHAIDEHVGVTGTNPMQVLNDLRANLGREPTPNELYQGYQQTVSEHRATMSENHATTSQQQLDQNPITIQGERQLPIEKNGEPLLAMKDPNMNQDLSGQRVKALDRGNVGKVVSTNEDGSLNVRFTNRNDKTTATKRMMPHEVEMLGGRKKADAPQLMEALKGAQGIKDTTLDPSLVTHERGDFARESQTLNPNNLDLNNTQRSQILEATTKEVRQTLSNKQIMDIAKSAGIDTKTHSIDQTAQVIAEQLNTRRSVVEAQNRFTQLQQSGASKQEIADAFLETVDKANVSQAQGTDLARQLQARRIMANELDTPMQRVIKLLNEAGVNPEEAARKAVDVNWNDAKDVVRFYRSLVPPKFGDWLDLVRYNSMLSSPLTQIVNIFSTAGNIAMAPVEKTLTGLLDAMRVGVRGGDRQYATGEGAAFIKGALKPTTLKQAVSDFRDSLNERELDTHSNAGIDAGRLPVAVHGDNKVVDALSFPMRVLGAFDAANKSLIRGGVKEGLALRERNGIKLPGQVGQIAHDESAYRTFNRELGDASQGYVFRGIDEVTNLVMKARSSTNPVVALPAKFTLPFVRIGVNLLKTGTEYSPFGVATIPGALNKTEQMSKVIMGTASMGIAASLLGQGRLTWAEPTSQKQKDAFRAAGMQPYSVKFGNKWISFAKLPPIISFNLAFVAGLDDAIKTSKLNQSGVDNLVGALAKYGKFLGDQSYYKNIGDMIGAVQGDKEKFTQLIGNYPQQIVPYRALGGWLASMTDGTQRKINTDAGFAEKQFQSLAMNIPGLRTTMVPARTDSGGNPIPAQHPIANAFSPAKITTEDPIHAQELADLQQKSLDTANKKIAKQTGVASGTDSGLDSKTQSRIDTATKKLPTGISDGAKKTLLNYARLSDQGKSKFESDPKNVYSLHQSQYEQDKLSGKLTPTEDFKRQKSLAHEEITSNYSKDVSEMYGLSKGDLQNFLDSHPDKQNLVNQVLELDKKIADAKGGKTKFGGTVASKKKGGGTRTARKSSGRKVALGLPNQTNSNKLNSMAKMLRSKSTVSSKGLSLPSYHPKKATTPKIAKIKVRKGSSKLT